jgi:hypothetical protein
MHEFTARYLGALHARFWKYMATPNYQFEKRRRELDKKAKKEEKRRLKLEAGKLPNADAPVAPDAPLADTAPEAEPAAE